ncbi:hypothetical protein F4604DRAFT_1917260 [Suillus subluteus]|nr:hypothetical protein F4604DRAFT_1917260 [Suillus subluteus]
MTRVLDTDDDTTNNNDDGEPEDLLTLVPAFRQTPPVRLVYLQSVISHITGAETVTDATNRLQDGLDLIEICGVLPVEDYLEKKLSVQNVIDSTRPETFKTCYHQTAQFKDVKAWYIALNTSDLMKSLERNEANEYLRRSRLIVPSSKLSNDFSCGRLSSTIM